MKLGRRSVLSCLGPVIGSGLPVSRAFGQQECRPSQYGLLCSSYIPIGRLARIYATQSMSEWCWAASISMIFAFNGHPVSQARIVRDAYGGIGNIPGNYPALFGSLDRDWTDDRGGSFTVSVNNLFAADFGGGTLTNADLAAALDDEQPILYCTAQHAMVLTSMSYVATNVVEAWVMDPWPGNGLRRLAPVEMAPPPIGQLRMAATLDIS
jgi:Papain-like cysteine protease AvrRpt2